MIVQLVGEDFQGSLAYEVVASGLRIPLNKPYYIAAAISDDPAAGQQFGGSVTFYARDLSDPVSPDADCHSAASDLRWLLQRRAQPLHRWS